MIVYQRTSDDLVSGYLSANSFNRFLVMTCMPFTAINRAVGLRIHSGKQLICLPNGTAILTVGRQKSLSQQQAERNQRSAVRARRSAVRHHTADIGGPAAAGKLRSEGSRLRQGFGAASRGQRSDIRHHRSDIREQSSLQVLRTHVQGAQAVARGNGRMEPLGRCHSLGSGRAA